MFGGRFDHGVLKKEINKKPGHVKNAAGPASGQGSLNEMCDPSKKLQVKVNPLKIKQNQRNQISPSLTIEKFAQLRSEGHDDEK